MSGGSLRYSHPGTNVWNDSEGMISVSAGDKIAYRGTAAGTFIRPTGVEWRRGEDGVPSGWTIIDYS